MIQALMGRTKCFNREEVLDKSIQVFWKKGFSDTSLQDLERATGVNKSGLYSEFKDKEDLFCESIKRYKSTNQASSLLSIEPLGMGNIEAFLKSSLNNCGEKGCYLANTMREISILPPQVKKILNENSTELSELILKNLKVISKKKDIALYVSMIMTFSAGISLKLNVMKSSEVEPEINFFIQTLKKLISE